MRTIFDTYSFKASKYVTKAYSTSFYAGVRFLDSKIRNDIHGIYGFVRFADEIVDTFHEHDKEVLLEEFIKETYAAIDRKISLNPILHSFQMVVNKYNIDPSLIDQFLYSMRMDLNPVEYTQEKFEEYILGSAEVVGLMCLKVFVYGNEEEYLRLKPFAMKLGSAFQKINFLRDMKADFQGLGRTYFPGIDMNGLTTEDKQKIEADIQAEFDEAFIGIKQLPKASRLGVYVSFVYYTKLLRKIKRTTANELMESRISVHKNVKMMLLAKSYVRNSMNLL